MRRNLATASLGLLVPVEDEHPTLLILGVLLTLRYLVPLLQQQVKDTSLKGSFGVTRKEMEVSPSAEQLVQVGAAGELWCRCVRDCHAEDARGREVAGPRGQSVASGAGLLGPRPRSQRLAVRPPYGSPVRVK